MQIMKKCKKYKNKKSKNKNKKEQNMQKEQKKIKIALARQLLVLRTCLNLVEINFLYN